MSPSLGGPVQPRPLLAVFGAASSSLALSKAQSDSIVFVTLLPRPILFKWKETHTFVQWIQDLLSFPKVLSL